MKISIITATYNSSEQIVQCVKSVNNQTHFDIEHIIIDGASNDNTLALINSIPNRISKIVSEPDNGIYDALNKGVKLATGDIIGFVHSDDSLFSNDSLQIIESTFKKKQCDVVYGDGIYVNKKDKIVRNWVSGNFSMRKIKQGWMPLHPTLYCKKELYKKHNFFDAKYSISADYDFVLKVFTDSTNRIKYINTNIIKMLIGGISTNPNFFLQKVKEDYLVMKSHNLSPFKCLPLKILSKISQFYKLRI
jgi:glycosyltransferase